MSINGSKRKCGMCRMLFSHKEQHNSVICRKTDGTRENYINQNKSNTETQIWHALFHMWKLIKQKLILIYNYDYGPLKEEYA